MAAASADAPPSRRLGLLALSPCSRRPACVARGVETLRARAATPEERSLLQLGDDAVVMAVRRKTFDADGASSTSSTRSTTRAATPMRRRSAAFRRARPAPP